MGDTENDRLKIESDGIFLNPIFLVILKIHSQMNKGINFLQWITKAASYKIAMGMVCGLLFGVSGYMVIKSLILLNRSYETISKKENILKDIVANHTHEQFWNDRRLFFILNEEHLSDHYQLFSEFIKSEFSNMKLQHSELDELMDNYATWNIVITSLPLLLNSPWWTNACTIIVTVMSKYAPKHSISAALTMIMLSFSLGLTLLSVHFVNLLFFAIHASKKNYHN